MGLSASQGRMLLLTARKSDLEFRAQQISQKRLILSQRLEEVATEYENATSNRRMTINLALTNVGSEESDKTTSTKNLTWANLVSGTLKSMSSDISGIKCSESDVIGDYTSTTCYRLKDVNGAIVVSSEDEIPTVYFTEKKTDAEKYKDQDGNVVQNLYTTTNIDKNGSSKGSVNYLDAVGDLKDALGDNKQKTVVVDTAKKIAIVTDENGEDTYYSITNGKKQADNYEYTGHEENQVMALLIKNASKKKGTSYTANSALGEEKLKPGADGVYTVTINGVMQRYVVDPSLRLGSTDGTGDTLGPNYLQDCIRNGKYLLERYNSGTEKWSSIEWDAASNIFDNYYTEDDDKAKAKYDRLQGQIQAQDKKLELELDDVETQRSAVSTETESVKKVISENVEKTFKTFA